MSFLKSILIICQNAFFIKNRYPKRKKDSSQKTFTFVANYFLK